MVSPVALLLVEGGEVAQERERAVGRFDGELGRGRRLGRGREMSSLHCWMGRGGGERRWGAFLQVGLLIESWSASNDSEWSRPSVQSPSLLFWQCPIKPPRAIIGSSHSDKTDACPGLASNPRRSRLWSRRKGLVSQDLPSYSRNRCKILATWHAPRWRPR